MSTTHFGGDELSTPEGYTYTPVIEVIRDADDTVRSLRVGLQVQEEIKSTYRTVWLVPSTSTDEGDGTGNVFLYEDDDPITHLAWSV